jgi:serine/threonine protein kinase
MPLLKQRNAEPIPGYRLIERLGCGGFGEVWKCEAPGGLFKAIKFVYGNLEGAEGDRAKAEEEWRAVERIKAIRHPFLLSMDRVELVATELVIVSELADRNLYDLLRECRKGGDAGIPRAELIGYLREAAEVLDLLNIRHGLQHLDVKPHNLFLVSDHVKVADFGLVNSLGGGEGGKVELGAITPLYAAPEVFDGTISRHSDQYSLAVVYQELLTGVLPFRGKNTRQLFLQHTQGEPDLSPLPEADRPLVARALAKDPAKRFNTCLEFVRALRAAGGGSPAVAAAGGTAGAPAPARTDGDPAPARTRPAAPRPPHEADTENDRPMARTTPRGKKDEAARPGTQPPRGAAVAAFRFLECLGTTPLLESWRVQAPDGRQRLLQLVYGAGGADERRREEAVLRFNLLHHPAVVPAEVLYSEPGRLILTSDLAEDSLWDCFRQCQGQGLPGVPRDELLCYLRTAAGALGYLYQQHSVQHLGLNPRTLRFERGRVTLTEFGLAQLFWLPSGQPVAQRNARYCAPELFGGQVSRACDQYSLAVIYQEMLTGVHPFRGSTPGVQSASAPRPNLDPLPAADRDIIARALHADPQQRWPSCAEMIKALAGEKEAPAPQARFIARICTPLPTSLKAHALDETTSPLGDIISQLVLAAGGSVPAGAGDGEPVLLPDEGVLRHRFVAGLPLGAARLKLEALRQQWYGQLVRDGEDDYVFFISLPAEFWRQLLGQQSGLEVEARLARQNPVAATPIEVAVEVRAVRCNRRRAVQLLEEVGASVLDGLRSALLIDSEKRIQERLLWPHPLTVRPVLPDGSLGEAVTCRGKDISLGGIGFYLPRELPGSDVRIDLPATPGTPAVSVPATLVRAVKCADGWYDVGALFRLAARRKSHPELCLP